jgi:hypothetical protein
MALLSGARARDGLGLAILLLLLPAATRVTAVDEVYTIPPAEWRYVPMELKQTPVALSCDFEVAGNGLPVRVALLSQADLERLRADQPHGFLAASPPATRGSFGFGLHHPGTYAVVVDNRALRSPVRVHLRVSLDFSGRAGETIQYLSPQRRLTVILISFAVFFGIVTWSARKLLAAVKN